MYGNSLALFKKAQRYMPGGANSPVRAFKGHGDNVLWKEDIGLKEVLQHFLKTSFQ